ncbi:hypothetical protein [Opitutus terrae]|uniref:hypothetical protein n=1 Tax=Opitutus terrae TaxID=107709 RepID=UPI00030C24E0|nr:hypothetical protein [Opitutus terrae]
MNPESNPSVAAPAASVASTPVPAPVPAAAAAPVPSAPAPILAPRKARKKAKGGATVAL